MIVEMCAHASAAFLFRQRPRNPAPYALTSCSWGTVRGQPLRASGQLLFDVALRRASGRRCFAALGFIAQMPRVAALLEVFEDVISNRVAFGLGEPFLEPTHHLASATKCKGNGVLENVATGHSLWVIRYENIA